MFGIGLCAYDFVLPFVHGPCRRNRRRWLCRRALPTPYGDEDACGYLAATEEAPCSHEHTKGCYQPVATCVREHTEDCYGEGGIEPVCSHFEKSGKRKRFVSDETAPHLLDSMICCTTSGVFFAKGMIRRKSTAEYNHNRTQNTQLHFLCCGQAQHYSWRGKAETMEARDRCV